MKNQPLTRRHFLQASGAAVAGAAIARPAEEGFTPLFDGQSLAGWEGDTLLWVVEDGRSGTAPEPSAVPTPICAKGCRIDS